jgi:predicted ATP-grasp superfamily ATP-dependent carboligase
MRENLSVLIPDGEDPLALMVARCLARVPNTKLFIVSSKRWTLSRFTRYHCSFEFRPRMGDSKERIETLIEFIRTYGVDVVLPVSERGAEFVAISYEALVEFAAITPLPSPQALRLAINKWSLFEFASELGLPMPASIQVTLDNAFYDALSALEYPVLLKPTCEAGGKGIIKFEGPDKLRAHLRTQGVELTRNKHIVQSYTPGVDLGLSVLCENGSILAYTIQQGLKAQYLGRLKAMQFVRRDDVLEIGQKLLSALNWSGVAHIDFRHDARDGKAKMLEVNGRYWGSLLGSLVAGVNFPHLACLTALGISFVMPTYQLKKYIQTGTAAKDFIGRLLGKSELGGFSFSETGWKFFVADPMPQVVNAVVNRTRDGRVRRFIPTGIRAALDEIDS